VKVNFLLSFSESDKEMPLFALIKDEPDLSHRLLQHVARANKPQSALPFCINISMNMSGKNGSISSNA